MDTLLLLGCWLLLACPGFILAQDLPCTSPTPACDCYIREGKRTINCRYKSLTEIPTFMPSSDIFDIIRFDSTEQTGQCILDCNNITAIKANAFANITVKSINLLNNPIGSVSDLAFVDKRDDLESLLIEGDGSTRPFYDAMAPLENLQTLHLENYNPVHLSSTTAVLPFPRLKSLTLKKWNNLQTMEQNVFIVMKNLTSFSLEHLPSMVNLPTPTIQQFLQLKTLQIFDTGITSIFGEVFSPLRFLSEVKIRQNNQLRQIDNRAFLNVVDTIVYLDLDGNKLQDLSFLLTYNWTQLSHLNIGYNYDLRTLPDNIFRTMPTMDYLQCADIGLTSLNEAMFRSLGNLHTIDLSYNNIQNIGTGFLQHSPNLVELRLNHQNTNGATIAFDTNAFDGIESSMEIINLSNNKLNIAQIWTDLSRFTNLLTFEMNQVGVVNIPNKTFENLAKLNKISLIDNNITQVNQATFFGPRNTLQILDLSGNQIQSIDSCFLHDFPTKPTLSLAGNNLRCDCDLVWLYDWVTRIGQTDEIGTCTSPPSLAGKYFDGFSRNEMCAAGTAIPNCPDLYATTTTSSTTTTSTTTPSTTTTEIPTPFFRLLENNADSSSVELTWDIPDKTHVTGIQLEMIPPAGSKQVISFGLEQKQYTFPNLAPDSYHTFCLILKIGNEYRNKDAKCIPVKTKPEYVVTTTTTEAPPEADSQLGVIIGASIGGVVLVALIIAIVVVLLKANKPKKPKHVADPVSFTMRANIPHEGGTAKRFAKKPGKEGADPDDINITVISNGNMSTSDRLSAGSYQTLNEKGVDHRPLPGTSHGHYTNSVEDRPLPKAPLGGATGHGYVNTNGAMPETSKNEYYEVRY